MRLLFTLLLILIINGVLGEKVVFMVNSSPTRKNINQGDEVYFKSSDGLRHNLIAQLNNDAPINISVDKNKDFVMTFTKFGRYVVSDDLYKSDKNYVESMIVVKNTEWWEKDAREQQKKVSRSDLNNKKPDDKDQDKQGSPAKQSDQTKQGSAAKQSDATINTKPKENDTKAKNPSANDTKAKNPSANDAKAKNPSTNTKPKADSKEIDNQNDTKDASAAKTKDKETNEGNSGSMLTINVVILLLSILSALLI